MDTLACAEATCLWLTKKYTNCHATLQKLESEGKSDLKLAHNLLVVEHAIVGSLDADRIAAQLELICNEKVSGDDAAGAAAAAAAADAGAGGSGGGGGGGRSRSSGAMEPLPLVPVRDDLAVAQLNRALLLHAQHRTAAASAALEPLLGDVEALAEGTAVRLLTLLLELHIQEGRQLPRAVQLLYSLERLYGTLAEAFDNNNGNANNTTMTAAQQQQQAQGQMSLAAAGAGGGGAAAGGGGGGGGGGGVGVRPRVLALPRVSRWSTGAMGRSKALLDSMGRPLAAPDLKLVIRLYRARLHALANNTRAAKRELKAVLAAVTPPPQQPPPTSQSPLPLLPQQLLQGSGAPALSAQSAQPQPAAAAAAVAASPAAGALLLAVRAQLELYRGRARKATKLLLGMLQDPFLPEDHRPLLLNNLGLAHHQQGRHTLALLCLSQALAAAGSWPTGPAEPAAAGSGGLPPAAAAAAAASSSSLPSCSSCSSSSSHSVPVPAVTYNAGLQHLLLHNYAAARRCFAAAASRYLNTPLLWLRAAEAALGLYRRLQQQHQEGENRRRLQQQQQLPSAGAAGGAAAAAAGGSASDTALVEGVITSSWGRTTIRGGGDAAAAQQQQQLPATQRRLVLPTGAAPSPAESGPGCSELLSEAVVALQTALQLLDAQQEAAEQWQSSSSKLEEGLTCPALPPPPPPACTQPAATTTSVGTSAAAAGSSGGGGAGPGELLPPSLPQPPSSQGEAHHQPPPQQRPTGQCQLSGGTGGGAEEELRPSASSSPSQRQQQQPSNAGGKGPQEPHGTDASAALSEEISAVRRAVLANLAYAHLQAEDWCAALQAARALLAASSPPSPATSTSSDPAVPTATTAAPSPSSSSSSSPSSCSPSPPSAAAPSAAAATAAAATEYGFLAHNYAAEALCHLDRPADAVEYLSLWLMDAQEREHQQQQQQHLQQQAQQAQAQALARGNGGGGGVEGAAGGGGDDGGEAFSYPLGNAAALAALSGPSAVAATAVNLGAVFASQGELAQATALARQALGLQPGSRAAALLRVYCELAAGNSAAALGLLKQQQALQLRGGVGSVGAA